MTKTEALDALNKAVEVRGADFVYPEEEKAVTDAKYPDIASCIYTRNVDGQTVGACLVGVALIDVLGLDSDVIKDIYDTSYIALHRADVDNILINRIYRAAQNKQDNGWTWGAARDFAIAEHAEGIREVLASEARKG
jgi:hypothetical protein